MLGHFVADLKYKRVYVTSVEALMKARVWEKARTLRPVHAVEIYQAKKMEAERIEVRKVKANEIEAKGITALTVCFCCWWYVGLLAVCAQATLHLRFGLELELTTSGTGCLVQSRH